MRYGQGAAAPAQFQNYARNNYAPNVPGGRSQGSFARSGNPNIPQNLHPQNYRPLYSSNGVGGWGYHDWDHYFQRPYWGAGWYGGWYWGYPWFPFWGGYPFGWDGYWSDYFCPYGSLYAAGYPMTAGGYPYADDGQYAANFGYAPSPQFPADGAQLPPNPQVAADDGEAAGNEGLLYYNEARAAFLQGDYRNALRLAGHSGVESPQNPKVHELTLLALFASGEYRAAATEAHAALALGPPSDWNNLYSYYNDAAKYTEQLRKLEKTVADVPDSRPDISCWPITILMTGAKPEAKAHFAQAAKLTPNDKLAQHILDQFQSNNAIVPPTLPKQPDEPKGKLL